MSRRITFAYLLITPFICALANRLVSASTFVIDDKYRGWFNESGFTIGPDNYIVGDLRGLGCGSVCGGDHRNYLVFDMAGITQPVTTAILALSVPNVPGPGYVSSNSSENYELHDVTTSIATLLNGTGGVAAHTDLGSGVVYGSRTMTAADIGTVVEIPLNSSAITALNSTHGLIAIGGSLTTLDSLPNNEYTFAYTHGVDKFGDPPSIAQLRLTVVPEPSTFSLLGIGAIFLPRTRRKKTQR